MIKIAIEPKSKGDLEKMSNGLIKLAQEDPSFNFSRDEETNQTVIEGMGELHLDIIVDRLRREFKVCVCPSCPLLPRSAHGLRPQGQPGSEMQTGPPGHHHWLPAPQIQGGDAGRRPGCPSFTALTSSLP